MCAKYCVLPVSIVVSIVVSTVCPPCVHRVSTIFPVVPLLCPLLFPCFLLPCIPYGSLMVPLLFHDCFPVLPICFSRVDFSCCCFRVVPLLSPCFFYPLDPSCILVIPLLFPVAFPIASLFFPSFCLVVSLSFPPVFLVVILLFRCCFYGFHFFVKRLSSHPKDQHAYTDREVKTNLPDVVLNKSFLCQ